MSPMTAAGAAEGAERPDDEVLSAPEAALLEQHRDQLCAPEVSTGPVSFDWHCGFWRALHVGGPAGSFQDSDEDIGQLVAAPSARFLRAAHLRADLTPGVAPRSTTPV